MRQERKIQFLVLLAATLLLSAGCEKGVGGEAGFRIINAHEHIQSLEEVPAFLEAMQTIHVEKTVLAGSPTATFRFGTKRFYNEEKNNEEILKISKAYPGRFIPFPTVDVKDPKKSSKLKSYLARGGRGLKLYSGNTVFHNQPLDHESMFPIYAFCEKKEIPILFHVNAGRYQAELENVLKRFPKLKVICPHFCLSSARLERLEYLLDQYPNLYTDISFGYLSHLTAGLKRFSANPRKYRNFMNQYQDRIFFGTDMVVSKTPYKTESWLAQVSRVYRDFLEKKTYDFFALSGERLRGLHLNQQVLEKIYRLNFERFMGGHDEE